VAKHTITDISELKETVGVPLVDNAKMSMRNVDVFYGDKQAIHGVDLDIGANEVIAMIALS
jgi:phosphate transport system ATP-binding protein